jgi:high-affinity iron transporter
VIATFVIFLREGIEASMIVAVLLSFLRQVGQRKHFRDIALGVGSALGLVTVLGLVIYKLVANYAGSRVQTYFETSTYLIAAVALTYMTFWMQHHARTISKELRSKSEVALSTGDRWGLATLAFQAVVREGLETMVFTLAIVFASTHQHGVPTKGSMLLLGAVAGLAVALAIAVAIYKVGAKINLALFFRVLGVTLMVFAAGLVADTIENFQTLGWLPIGRTVLWNTSGSLAQSSNLGDVLHAFVGYADHPTVAQLGAWAIFVVSALYFYLRPRRTA